MAAGQLPAPPAPRAPVNSLPGYTIVRELHRGGQGVVYLAVQESTGRQVAIKLLNRQIPAGSASGDQAGLARFEREIEILSRLKRPNIVTVHDCGRDHGHVYLVMNFVDGRTLDAWASRPGALLAQTLEVFARICDGVNAAHLLGVIHRDLRPGNILVDERDDPHVLDFGLAKLVDGSDSISDGMPTSGAKAGSRAGSHAATDAGTIPGAVTVTGQFVGSIPWASPEQAEGRTGESGDAIDIRTDVYSLGVILYQVLTERFPYPVAGRLSEVVRHIVESEPVRPSSIDRSIDRELETIVLKCLAKQPERRYQSAGELARDLRRYLAGEAIEARRDSLVYLMTKRIARYRVAAIAAAALLVVVLGALIISIGFWREAEHQSELATVAARIAEREASQASAVTEFMREILTSVEPEHEGAEVRLVEVLERASAETSPRFAEHPQQEAQVRELLGQVYEKLSMWAEAKVEFGHAAELWRRVAGDDDPRALLAQLRHIHQMTSMAQFAEAEPLLSELAPRTERVHGPNDPRTLLTQTEVAFTALKRGRLDEAERLLTDLRARARLISDDAVHIQILRGFIDLQLSRLGPRDQERSRELLRHAEELALESLERTIRLRGRDSTQALNARLKWANISCQLRRHRVAADACREILERSAARLAPCHHVRTNAMYTLAEALTGLGEDREPAALHLERVDCLRAQLEPESILMLSVLFDALRYLERGGSDFAPEGEAIARELSAALEKLGGGHGEIGVVAEHFVAHFVSMQGRLEEADKLFRALLDRENELLNAAQARARLHLYHAGHLTRLGRFEEAEAALATATELVGDIRIGTWDSHPDDIVMGYIALHEAWGAGGASGIGDVGWAQEASRASAKADRLQEYRRMRAEMIGQSDE